MHKRPYTDLSAMLDDILTYQAVRGLPVEPHDDPSAGQIGYRAEDRSWAIATKDAILGFKRVGTDVPLLFRSVEGRRRLVSPSLTLPQAFAIVWEQLCAGTSGTQPTSEDVRMTLVKVLTDCLPKALTHTERWVLAYVSIHPTTKQQLSIEWEWLHDDDRSSKLRLVDPDDDSDYPAAQTAELEDLLADITYGRQQIVIDTSPVKHGNKQVYDAIDRLLAIGLIHLRNSRLTRVG